MHILVASQLQAGAHKAHAINVVKTAGGFAQLGHEVLICCNPPKENLSIEQLGSIYGEPSLQWAFYPGKGPESQDPAAKDRASWAFAEWVIQTAQSAKTDFVFARDYHVPLLAAKTGLATVMETHAYIGDTNPMLMSCFSATADTTSPLSGITTISERLKNYYTQCGAAAERIHIVPDGVDVRMFERPTCTTPSPYENKTDNPRAVYCGHLYDYKGIPCVLQAAKLLPSISFEIIGGLPEDIARTKQRIESLELSNVTLHGLKQHSDVPQYLWHADVLLLPPSAKEASASWTSPVKLGEYLASGTTIVASRIPALQDWLTEATTFWFAPDDAHNLAEVIVQAIIEPDPAKSLRQTASLQLAKKFSYPNRAVKILAAGDCPSDSKPVPQPPKADAHKISCANFENDLGYPGLLPDEIMLKWFNDDVLNARHILSIYSIARGLNAQGILEIGFGASSFVLARAAAENQSSLVVCDSKDASHKFTDEEKRWSTFFTGLPKELWKSLGGWFDFALFNHFDSSSTDSDQKACEMLNALPFMRTNGILAITFSAQNYESVNRAVAALTQRKDLEASILPLNSGLAIVRYTGASSHGRVEDIFVKKQDG